MPTKNGLRIEYMPLTDLLPAVRNPKLHDEAGLDASLARFGYMEPVLMDERTERLVGGHGRQERCRAWKDEGRDAPANVRVRKADGEWLIPVTRGWSSENDKEAEAALIALNSLTERGGWNQRLLADMLSDLRSNDVPLDGTGYRSEDLDNILGSLAKRDTPPEEFKSFTPEDLPTDHTCPRCGFEF